MVSGHKDLRLTISNDGHWGKHVDLITKKAFTRVNIMRKFKLILDRRTTLAASACALSNLLVR
jgi:hypothetical protein